jgi:GNAT superfamily N-acetyltransferase
VSPGSYSVATVTAEDLEELLPLMRAYCDFYETAPSDEGLLDLARALPADAELEGVQLIARDERGAAVGFATVFWSWDTTEGARIGIMNDLFVAPQARGSGVADKLVEACVERCKRRGAARLEWQTGPDNARAQAVYDRLGGVREPWLVYSLPTR